MRSKRSGNLRGLEPLMIYMTLVPFLGPDNESSAPLGVYVLFN